MEESHLSWSDFEKVEMRTGTIIEVDDFPQAHNSSYKLRIDFGEFGVKKSSAQITDLYSKESLLGKQIIAVVNFKPKQIANFMSECLILGSIGEKGEVTLIKPELNTLNGSRIG